MEKMKSLNQSVLASSLWLVHNAGLWTCASSLWLVHNVGLWTCVIDSKKQTSKGLKKIGDDAQ